MNYRDTIEYRECCLSYYRNSKKALSLSTTRYSYCIKPCTHTHARTHAHTRIRTHAHPHTHTFSNLSGSKASAVATGPKVGVKLGVEKIPARPCAGRDVGRGSVAAVVSLVTVSLETERADGNTLVSVLGGFGCLAFASIGWVGSGSVDGVDRGGGGCKGRRGEERRWGSRAREGGRECQDIRNRDYTICLEYKAGDSYVHAYVRMYKYMWT